jgi:mevalonate kinase
VNRDKIDKEQYETLLEENMKDVAQIVQTKDDKPQNIDNIITEFSNIMVKTAEQLCPKRKCKKKRKRVLSSIFKIGVFTDLTHRCLFTNAKHCLSFRSLRFIILV